MQRFFIMTTALLLSMGAAQSQVLKNEPTEGNLPSGKRVLVDDGPAQPVKSKK
jgi:hypothetical protein